MDFELKAASIDDIAPLLEWNKALIDRYEDIESIDYEKVLVWCERKIRKCLAEYFCIWYRGEKAGYIRSHLDGNRVELDNLYIFPEFQSRGIGTAVLQHYIHASDCPI